MEEDTWNKITDIRANGSLSHFLSYFSVMEPSSPFFENLPVLPSLPLRKAPPFSPSLSSIVFTPPSVPPGLGDRNPQGRETVTALRCSEPLRSKVGGPKRSSPWLCGMGPSGVQYIIRKYSVKVVLCA